MSNPLSSFTKKEIQNLPSKVIIHGNAEDDIENYSLKHFNLSKMELLRGFQILFSWTLLSPADKTKFGPAKRWFMGKMGPMSRPNSAKQADINRMHLYSPNVKKLTQPGQPPAKTPIISKDRTRKDWETKKNGIVTNNLPNQQRTSDTYLVYCRSVHVTDKLCLLGIIDPHAHYESEQIANFSNTFVTRAEAYQNNALSQ